MALVDSYEIGVGSRRAGGQFSGDGDLGARATVEGEADQRATFTRRLSANGRASVSLTRGQLTTLRDQLDDIGTQLRDWHHELLVRVNGADAFAGPLTDISYGDPTVDVTAEDYSAFWRRHWLPGPFAVEQVDGLRLLDAAFAACVAAARDLDVTAGVPWRPPLYGQLLGRAVDLSVDLGDDVSMDVVARTATDAGWEWTWIGTDLWSGADGLVRRPDGEIPTLRLTDEDWASAPKLRRVGAERATRVIVHGDAGIRAVATAAQSWLDFYGLLTRVEDRPDITSYSQAAALAGRLLAESVEPVRPQSANLASGATVTVAELVPGSRVYASSVDWEGESPTIGCRLSAVSVAANGEVRVEFDPMVVTDAVATVELG